MNRPTQLLCLISLLRSGLNAHDLYILPDSFYVTPKTMLPVGYHNGDSFPKSEVAPRVERLKDTQLRSGSKTVAVDHLRVAGKRVTGTVEVVAESGDLLLSVHTAPNFIELAPQKFLDYLKEEGLTNVISWRAEHGETRKVSRERYSKFAKAVVLSGTPDDNYRQSLGFVLEIIPESNPYSLHSGEELPVRVMFRGMPAAGLQLEAAWFGNGQSKTTVIGRTGLDGRIRVPISAAGKWRLHSLLMERCADPAAADWESFWASLTFETALGLVLDSSGVLAAERKKLAVTDFIEDLFLTHRPVDRSLSPVTVADLARGIYRAKTSEASQRRRE